MTEGHPGDGLLGRILHRSVRVASLCHRLMKAVPDRGVRCGCAAETGTFPGDPEPTANRSHDARRWPGLSALPGAAAGCCNELVYPRFAARGKASFRGPEWHTVQRSGPSGEEI